MAITDDMITTDDGSMVKVIMKDPGSEAVYLSVDQALYLESRGKCTILRTSGYEMTPDGKVMVEHIEKGLIQSYGPYGSYRKEDAELGEKKNKWRIVRRGARAQTYETGMMTAKLPGMTTSSVPGQTYETKNVKKKRVAWIQDHFLRGGAEISSELVIKVGRDCGYQIDEITPRVDANTIKFILDKSDFAVIGNFFGFDQSQTAAILRSIYGERKPYVKYEHDHRELDRPEFAERLFRGSRLNVFLSPLHLKNHEKIGADGICLPLAIDVDHFQVGTIGGAGRRSNVALVCNVRNFKFWTGLQAYIDEHKEIEFHVISKDELPVSGDNVRKMTPVSYEQMPQLYAQAEFLVHILDGWGAGERVVFEACLCGCKVVSNERVGHTSWNRPFEDTPELREWLRQAPYEFWKEVEKVIT